MRSCIVAAVLATAAAAGAPARHQPLANQTRGNLSQYGVKIFTGMVEAFLHSDNLTQAELRCLVDEAGDAAYEAYESSETMSRLLTEMRQKSKQAPLGSEPAELGMLAGQLSISLHKVVGLSRAPISHCVRGRAAKSLEEAAEHLRNAQYVAGSLLANGANLMMELTAATDAFHDRQYYVFGRDMGRACRKVLLSGDMPHLPEGPPTSQQIVNLTAGVLEGFFGPGIELVLEAGPEAATIPEIEPIPGAANVQTIMTSGPSTEVVHINLHKCVERNLDYFQEMLQGAWYFFAAQEATSWQASPQDAPGQMPVLFLAKLPRVLQRCNIGREQQEMLADSLMTLGRADLESEAPRAPKVTPEFLLVELNHAAQDWAERKWIAFGRDLGEAMRRLLTEFLPQLYSVDHEGKLHRQVLLASRVAVGGATRKLPPSLPILAGASLLLLAIAFITRRGGMRRRAEQAAAEEGTDVESNLLVE